MKRGVATFTLDTGHCPPWLFERMVKLGREMLLVMAEEYGPQEIIARLADPVWFQSLGTVLAFDWNASGLTTILTAALKEAILGNEQQFGIFICGGKGKTSRKTPEQIQTWGERLGLPKPAADNLEYNSRMAAKVDSALVQDGYELYHHAFFFSLDGSWAVVQQGMNQDTKSARRYHWYSDDINDLIVEPHKAIASQAKSKKALNLTAAEGEQNRKTSVELAGGGYQTMMKDLQLLDKHLGPYSRMVKLGKVPSGDQDSEEQLTLLELYRGEFSHHPVEAENFSRSKYLQKILYQLSSDVPGNYEKLVSTPGVGAKTVRALSLVGEVIYGAKASYRDPARYGFAHGGKDGTPYPVDTKTYDVTIATIKRMVERSKLDRLEKRRAMAQLDAKLVGGGQAS